MNDYVGTVIAGRYAIESVVGVGGHGVVFRATDRRSGAPVAVKMLSDSVAGDPTYAARLAREQDALLTLAGTAAVAAYDMCEAPNGSLCLVMELLEGTDLEKYLGELEARGQTMPVSKLAAIMDPIVDTLERAHEAQIVHRDLKPGNIFLLASGEGVRLFDFGLSRKKTSARVTAIGMVMGSPSYIAPEVWRGNSDDLDHRVDVYSLGVILFRALGGRLPFQGQNLRESLALATAAERPSLRALRPDLPPAVDDWVRKALAIDREERFQSVTACWMALLGVLGYTPPPRAIRPVQKSLTAVWKAARSAFRRFIPGASAADEASTAKPPAAAAVPPPVSPAPPRAKPRPPRASKEVVVLADAELESDTQHEIPAPPAAAKAGQPARKGGGGTAKKNRKKVQKKKRKRRGRGRRFAR